MNTQNDLSANLKAELSCFIGSEHLYRLRINPQFLYTDGVQYFAENAGCYWFLDIVATEIFDLQKNHPFLVVELDVRGSKADIRVTDGDGHQVFKRHISFTDCPEENYKFFLSNSVLMLPSEY